MSGRRSTGLPTQRDVAARAGVSSSTVSLVLRGATRYRAGAVIPEATIRKVTTAATELGYVRLTQRQRRAQGADDGPPA